MEVVQEGGVGGNGAGAYCGAAARRVGADKFYRSRRESFVPEQPGQILLSLNVEEQDRLPRSGASFGECRGDRRLSDTALADDGDESTPEHAAVEFVLPTVRHRSIVARRRRNSGVGR